MSSDRACIPKESCEAGCASQLWEYSWIRPFGCLQASMQAFIGGNHHPQYRGGIGMTWGLEGTHF